MTWSPLRPGSERADQGEDPPREVERQVMRLHVETAVAVQIGIATGAFPGGRRVRGDERRRAEQPPGARRGLIAEVKAGHNGSIGHSRAPAHRLPVITQSLKDRRRRLR